MNKLQRKSYYKDRYFYEVFKGPDNNCLITLCGPLENIRVLKGFKGFAQVINGKIVAHFNNHEILTVKGKPIGAVK